MDINVLYVGFQLGVPKMGVSGARTTAQTWIQSSFETTGFDRRAMKLKTSILMPIRVSSNHFQTRLVFVVIQVGQ